MSLCIQQPALRSFEKYLRESFFEYFNHGVFLYHSLTEPSSSHPEDTKLGFMDLSNEDEVPTRPFYLGELKHFNLISVKEAKRRNPNLETLLQKWSDSQKEKDPSFKPKLPQGLNVV